MGLITRFELQESHTSPERVAVTSTSFGLELTPTIFHETWWMELSCDGRHREATVSSGGRIVGRLPYLHERTRLGLSSLRMPTMAYALGPALLQQANGDCYPNAVKQISVTRDLIAQLPSSSHISFRLHGGISNTLAFNAAGFSSSVDFTVVVPPAPQEVGWRRMHGKTRNVIRRAQEQLSVGESLNTHSFLDFYEANLQARGRSNHYDRRICQNVMNESFRRSVGRIVTVSDAAGKLQSALFSVWDHQVEYYFMSTRSPGSMNGATSLAIWAALQHAARRGLAFDMAGLHVHRHNIPNLRLLTSFGGTIAPRYVVQCISPAAKLARGLRRFISRP